LSAGARTLPIYQVDAFSRDVFGGNPAAVVICPDWLPDATLQAIAAENNLAETAFVVAEGERFGIRWFTPTVEVPLCGHATLASAHVLLANGYARSEPLEFRCADGSLRVSRDGERLALDFPAFPATCLPDDPAVGAALGGTPCELHESRGILAVFASEAEVRALRPDFAAVARLHERAVIATAPGSDADFVSRFFAPQLGVSEDPVTGSAHCSLIPFWSRRLGRARLFARQVSARGGELWCEDRGARVTMAGYAVQYLQGTITL
jgi:predicted PhzF superfamily epimerase YddE/YHI9